MIVVTRAAPFTPPRRIDVVRVVVEFNLATSGETPMPLLYPTCSNSNEAFQSPRSVPAVAKSSSLVDFSASKKRSCVQGSLDALSCKAMDANLVAGHDWRTI
ncbi:hypothetical protein Droror1_Dr00016488 [Drosera rotundifolia]